MAYRLMLIVHMWYLSEKLAKKLARTIGLLIAVNFISEFSGAFKGYDFSFSQD
jgi:hypothetical protein